MVIAAARRIRCVEANTLKARGLGVMAQPAMIDNSGDVNTAIAAFA